MSPEFRIKQVSAHRFIIETRKLEKFLFWETWTAWEVLGLKHHYDYHREHSVYYFPSEKAARLYIDNLLAVEEQKRKDKEVYPIIINYHKD